MGYVNMATNRSRISTSGQQWREFRAPKGFAFWYWRLLAHLYEKGAPGLRAPVPQVYLDEVGR